MEGSGDHPAHLFSNVRDLSEVAAAGFAPLQMQTRRCAFAFTHLPIEITDQVYL
jgi:hypothetical protein